MGITTTLTISNGIAFTSTGVEVSRTFTFEEWLQAGLSFRQFVSTVDAAVAFCWGDWLNLGDDCLAAEQYTQGLDVVLPAHHDPTQRADSTLSNYKWGAKNTPQWMRGLPGLSFRHYLDAIRIKDHTERYEHLVQASTNGWSIRKAAELLPGRDLHSAPLPATKDDILADLTETNYRLEHELATERAARKHIDEARSILEDVVDDLPAEQAQRVRQALGHLEPVVVNGEFVELAVQVVRLFEAGAMAEMVEVIERLKGLLGDRVTGGLQYATEREQLLCDP